MNPFTLTALLGACAVAAGCGTTESSAPSIAASAASVEAARSAGAPELDAVNLSEARSKLEKARALAAAGDDRGALRMAEQADVDAQLARAKAGSETRGSRSPSWRPACKRCATSSTVRPPSKPPARRPDPCMHFRSTP